MKAYTQELRERIVAAVDHGVPREEVAEVFGVGLSTIKRYLKQRRETGSVAANVFFFASSPTVGSRDRSLKHSPTDHGSVPRADTAAPKWHQGL